MTACLTLTACSSSKCAFPPALDSQQALLNSLPDSQRTPPDLAHVPIHRHVDEWAIPVENVEPAMVALKHMVASKGMHVHYPVEVRFVKGDDIWCSPAYGRDTAYIGIIMFKPYGFNVPYRAYFDEFEHIMAQLGGRPHWAKDFRFNGADMANAYPMWKSFQRLVHLLDPHGVFCNEWAQRVVKGADGEGGALQPWLSAKEGALLAEQVERYDRKSATGEQVGDFSTQTDS